MIRLPCRYKPSSQITSETRAYLAKLSQGDDVCTHTQDLRARMRVTLRLPQEVRQ